MQFYKAKLRSTTPIIFSRQLNLIDTPKLEREQPGAYDERTWREKAHFTADDDVIIPLVYFKRAMEDAAKYLSIKVAGKGQSTYTKHVVSGVQMIGEAPVICHKDDLKSVMIQCNADGKRGSGVRVPRRFPIVADWTADVTIMVVDEIITKDVLQDFLSKAGILIGIGSFRINKGNANGAFKVVSLEPTEIRF